MILSNAVKLESYQISNHTFQEVDLRVDASCYCYM